MSVTVKFNEVGRNKVSWEVTLPTADEDLILHAVKKRGAFLSSGIDIEISDDGKCGTIFVGGFRAVGKFEIIPQKQEAV